VSKTQEKKCKDNRSIGNNKPDALLCGKNKYKGYLFYINGITADKIFYQLPSTEKDIRVVFKIGGRGWHSEMSEDPDQTAACKGKSLFTLIEENLAVYFAPTRNRYNSDSIVQGRPDAISCDGGFFYYAKTLSTESESKYGLIHGNFLNEVIFNGDADGTFNSRLDHFGSAGCEGKSLKDLYDECKAYNLVSFKPEKITGKNTDKKINEWPYAIDCSTNASVKTIFYAQALQSVDGIKYIQTQKRDSKYNFVFESMFLDKGFTKALYL